MEQEKTCRTCWWLSDEFTSVCVNEGSPHCADFVLLNDSCPWYDPDERKTAVQNKLRLPLLEENNGRME